MSYLRKRRAAPSAKLTAEPDPLDGLINMFDLGVVFMVGLSLALASAHILPNPQAGQREVGAIRKTEDGHMEIITKKSKQVKVERVTDRKIGGTEGVRLGTAYRLSDGRMVYVPE